MFNCAFRKSSEYSYIHFFITNVEADIKFGNGYNAINFGKWLVICTLDLYHSEKRSRSITGHILYIRVSQPL